MSRSRLLVSAFVLGVAGCSGTDGTAPDPIEGHKEVYAASNTSIIGLPGTLASNPPSVRVVSNPMGDPVAGVKVSFTFPNNRGSQYSTVTDSKGFAVLENMRLDSRAGPYEIVATAEGVGSVTFSAISLSGKITSTYDLRGVAFRTGPPTLLGTGEAMAQRSGAHYQVFDDGTYRIVFVWNNQTYWTRPAPFIRRGEDVLEFYIDPAARNSGPYSITNYVFAIGTITGEVMTLAYQDFPEFGQEQYALAK